MSAQVIPFPAAPSSIDDLFGQFVWMCHHQFSWENEEEGGYEPPSEVARRCFQGYSGGEGGAEALAEARRHITSGRERIRKRKRVKAWLRSVGVSLDQVRDAEDALFLAYDRLQAR